MISELSSYTSFNRKGISGLASGLDTDSIIKGMTSATTGRMTKLLQDRQKISWKTDAFRDISSKLIAFSDKYTSFTSPTNLFSENFFRGSTVTALGGMDKYVTVKGSSANTGSLSITDIKQTAATASFAGGKVLSNNKITTGDLDFSADGKVTHNLAGQSVNLQYDGKLHTITFDQNFKGTNATDVQAAFQAKLNAIELDDGSKLGDAITVNVSGGNKLEISTDPADEKNVIVAGASNQKALTALGLKLGATGSKGTPIVGEEITLDNLQTKLNFNDTLKGKQLTFNLNGVSKNITFANDIDFKNIGEFETYVQDQLNKNFGANRISVAANGTKLEFQVKKDGGATADPTSKLTISSSGADVMGENGILSTANGANNKVSLTASMESLKSSLGLTFDADGKGSITVNDVKIDFTETDAIKDVLDRINKSEAGVTIQHMETSDTFSIVAKESGAAGRIDIADGGGGNLSQVLFGKGTLGNADLTVEGKDAIMTYKYDGQAEQTVVRSSNSFDLDGLTLTLTPDAAGKAVAGAPIRFSAVGNADEVVKGIESMVKDYNELIALVNKSVSTKPDRKYPPLTDDQRKDMSDEQIKVWEDKAKAGILFGESELVTLASELRFAFSFDVAGEQALKDMGISTSTAYTDNGKLNLDVDKLKAALEKNPDAIKDVFTKLNPGTDKSDITKSGLMERVKGITDKYAKTTGTTEKRGILIQKAGLKDSITAADSHLQKQIDDIDKSLENWKYKLKRQEDRYYAQFTALETYMSKMNAQSSWLTQQTGG